MGGACGENGICYVHQEKGRMGRGGEEGYARRVGEVEEEDWMTVA